MGGVNTRTALDNTYVNFRKIKRAKKQKAKQNYTTAAQATLTVRGHGYSTAKKHRKDQHRQKMITKQSKALRQQTLKKKIQVAEAQQEKSKMAD